jgi:hypothetical protein
VLPLGFNYSPFRKWGKTVHLNFGTPLQKPAILSHDTEGKQHLAFNTQLEAALQKLVYEIDANDKATLKKRFFVPSSPLKLLLLALPAALGWLLHAPLYYAARTATDIFFDNDHYDSVVVSLLMLAYPLYLLLLCSWQPFMATHSWPPPFCCCCRSAPGVPAMETPPRLLAARLLQRHQQR